jgi:lipid-A-disaccharide synthase
MKLFVVAGEESGDILGAGLVDALTERLGQRPTLAGIGGPRLMDRGLVPVFPMSEIEIMGFGAVVRALPRLIGRIRETAAAIIARPPDAVVLIDAQDFSKRVAARVRALRPDIPIVLYVGPTVWFWRPGRARVLANRVDRVLAVLPFEPGVMASLGGPPTTYVGHPLIEKTGDLRGPGPDGPLDATRPVPVLCLPGSRRSEVTRLSAIFGETLARAAVDLGSLDVTIVTLPRLEGLLAELTAGWSIRPRIVTGDADKAQAFRSARVALAASGTVTLELALAGIPMVAAYHVPAAEEWLIRRLARPQRVVSVLLVNHVLGEHVVPDMIQKDCTPEKLAPALVELLRDTPARARQREAFATLDETMGVGRLTPRLAAADAVLQVIAEKGRGRLAAPA